MKTVIHITGKPQGNNTLNSMILGGQSYPSSFGSYEIQFQTVTEAKRQLKKAFQQLKSSGEKIGPQFNFRPDKLVFDSSIARVVK
jgi:hypothetical protein